MLRKSELPPTFSCIVRSRWTPRSPKSVVSTRWVIVAPTCDLMSSPMIGHPASSKRFCQYALARDEDRHAVHHRDAGLEDLLRVPLRRRLGADREVVDDDVRAGLLQDPDDVVRLAGRLLDDLRDVLADAVVRHAARDLHAGLRDVGELDRVVRVRPDRVGEVDADLALHDVERGGELDVRDVVPAEVDVHEAGDGVRGLRVLVVLDSLQERVCAVAHADDRDAHLVLRARAVLLAVRAGHEFPSFAIALCAGRRARAASAARMTSFALESRRDDSAWIASFSSCGTRRRRTGLEPASTLRRRPVGTYATRNSRRGCRRRRR